MSKLLFVAFILASVALAQSSSDGSFSVRNAKQASYSLNPTQMREAESLYQSACATVQHEFHSSEGELRPHFTLVIGADRNEVHNLVQPKEKQGNIEIWMKKWDPRTFAQGVVVLAFNQMLTADVITQLGNRAFRYSNATVGVIDLK